MCRVQRSPFRIALAVSSAVLLFGGPVMAQSVPTFDDAPSIEQLRSIMIPQSAPGAGRTIVMQHPEIGPSPVQRASAQVASEPRPAPAPATPADASVAPIAETEPVQVAQPVAKPAPSAEAGVVAFHINFAFNSAELPASADPMVDNPARPSRSANARPGASRGAAAPGRPVRRGRARPASGAGARPRPCRPATTAARPDCRRMGEAPRPASDQQVAVQHGSPGSSTSVAPASRANAAAARRA